MTTDQTTSVPIEKGSLVVISGLQSEVGMKLNGSLGIILNSKGIMETNGALRYPVHIFAVKHENGTGFRVLETPDQKKIKAENMHTETDASSKKMFQENVFDNIRTAQSSGDMKNLLWWLEVHHMYWPDDYALGITYANLVRHIERDCKKAFTIIEQYVNVVPASDEKYPQYCYDISVTLIMAEQRLGEALDLALKIPPTYMSNNLTLFSSCLEGLIRTCNRLIHEDPHQDNPELCDVYLRACVKLSELDPNKHILNLAAAYCLAGNNLEGAKLYRRALSSAAVPETERKRVTRSLMMAQLQCPGMPLEDYKVINVTDTALTCIKKDDMASCTVVSQCYGKGRLDGKVTANGDEGLQVLHYKLPSSPDDPESFPASFLELLAS